ncbi:MAG: hypothetical protein PQJ46_17025 [Spirochaetales bacterium]|nr:hypothetical protein [Spirochaetales bacterium]
MKTLILYYTKTGHTLEAVTSVAEGLKAGGAEVTSCSVKDFTPSMLDDCDSLIAASPCWAGSFGKNGAAKPLVKVIDSLPEACFKGKKCGAVAVHAASGGENTISHLERLLRSKGCSDFKAGPFVKAGNPLSIGKGSSVSADDEKLLCEFGENFTK